MENDYEYFKGQVLKITGINLSAYKEKQMKRRIDTLILRNHLNGYQEFLIEIGKNAQLLDTFVNYLTINVSECYRNPEQWEILDKVVLPELIKKYGQNLTIWSAACSTGEEPYSLVMALSKHLPLEKIHIIATDIDKQVLEKAKVGLYTNKSIVSVPNEFKTRFFIPVGDCYRIKDEVKNRVEFRQHNLLSDAYLKNVNLIVCRNVLIYFTEEAKLEIFSKFHDSLTSGGILFLGSTEQMLGKQQGDFERVDSFFFRRP